jgi:hypothetical protein
LYLYIFFYCVFTFISLRSAIVLNKNLLNKKGFKLNLNKEIFSRFRKFQSLVTIAISFAAYCPGIRAFIGKIQIVLPILRHAFYSL